MRSEGFALFVAVANSPLLRDRLIADLRQSMPGTTIHVVALPPSTVDPLAEVLAQLPRSPVGPVMIVGLEGAIRSDQEEYPAFFALNLSRPRWPEKLPVPVVLWVPDYLLGMLGRRAPDFLDWRSDTVHFPDVSEGELQAFDRMTTSGGADDGLPLKDRLDRIEELRSRIAAHRDSQDRAVLATVASWLGELGNHLGAAARYADAEAAYRQALDIAEAVFGPDDPRVGGLVNNLANVLHDRGDLAGSRVCLDRALRIAEGAHGPRHTTVAAVLNNLGSVLKAQGDLSGAREQFQKAMEAVVAACGPDHPHLATTLGNLGQVLQAQGDLAGARACFERALGIHETTYGPDHPGVATDFSTLGSLLQAEGDGEGARALFEKALRIDETTYGPNHPRVATDLGNLASVLRAKGDVAAARASLERALRIEGAAYGQDHPDVAWALNSLGSVLYDQGDLGGARACYERALAILRKSLGEDHPHTRLVRANLEALQTASSARDADR